MSNIEYTDNSDKILSMFNDRIDPTLEAVGIHLEGEAKEELENSPRRIDTGLLRNSITHALSGKSPAIHSYHADKGSNRNKKTGKRLSAIAKTAGSVKVGRYNGTAPEEPEGQKAVYIGTNVEYAIYVHEGTSKMEANRFLKNACERNEGQIRRYIEKNLKFQLPPD